MLFRTTPSHTPRRGIDLFSHAHAGGTDHGTDLRHSGLFLFLPYCLRVRYTIQSSDAGVGVSYSAMRRVESLERVADAYAADLSVSAKEGVTGRHIVM